MNLDELPLQPDGPAAAPLVIKLVGVGGAGANIVDRLQKDRPAWSRAAVVNTDQASLAAVAVAEKLLLGAAITRGLGTGGDLARGREAAEADREKLAALMAGCDLVFLTGGEGGGTGGGALPVAAEAASKAGALVIAFVTMPFSFEGGPRLKQADEGLQALRRACDAIIALPNDLLLQEGDDRTSVQDAFARADEWMGRGMRSICAMLTRPGLISLDFASLRQVFAQRGGRTLFGLGRGQGATAAAGALADLKLCPLLHLPDGLHRADRLLVNITGGTGLALPEVNEIMKAVTEQFGRDSQITVGAVVDESMGDAVEICVIGANDGGGRVNGSRRPAQARQSTSTASAAPVPAGKGPTLPDQAPASQEEFGFEEVVSRGLFDKTERNLFDGQDLDVPTYLRKGIRISL